MRSVIGPGIESLKALAAAYHPKICLGYLFRLALCLLSSTVLQAQDPKFDASWRHCEANPECVVIRGSCGEPECVNRRFSEKASEWYRNSSGEVDCLRWFGEQQAKAVCQENQCRCENLSQMKTEAGRDQKNAGRDVNGKEGSILNTTE